MKPPPDQEPDLREEFNPPGLSLVAATVAIAATYVYFLVFAQLGFLKAVEAANYQGPSLLQPIMAVMGAAGIAGSFLMAWIFQERRGRGRLMAGFVIAGAAAALVWFTKTPGGLLLGAALTGTGIGMVTVGLAGMLRREVGGGRLGRCIGIGTGAAYAVCNLPPVFNGTAHTQAMLGIAAACTGLIAVQLFEQRAPRQNASGYDYSPGGKTVWIGIFLTLVWLDTATFTVIQQTAGLKTATWSGEPQLYLNAGIHLVAGVLAGLALDRRHVTGALLAATGLLAAGGVLMVTGRGTVGAPVYAAGVSIYSAALVFYPSRHGRVGLAALVYAVAGWTGTALGIGAAEKLGSVPAWFLLVAGVVPLLLVGRAVKMRTEAKPVPPGRPVQ